MIWHADAPGQANGQFGHRDDWKEWCSLCYEEHEENKHEEEDDGQLLRT